MIGLTAAFDALWEMQQAFDQAAKPERHGFSTAACGTPAVNVYKEGGNSLVVMEVPGVLKEDIEVDVKGKTLRIAGKRKITTPEGATLKHKERSDLNFERNLELEHEIDAENVKAELKDGVLALLLPPQESEKPKNIEIN